MAAVIKSMTVVTVAAEKPSSLRRAPPPPSPSAPPPTLPLPPPPSHPPSPPPLQGDEGNFFYVVDAGAFDCFVKTPDTDGYGKLVLQYGAGTTFGELALMYNTPRAASVVATADSSLFAMDRETFRTILLQMMCQKRLRFEALLEQIPLLRSMQPYERSSIADAFMEVKFAAGDVILREGDTGDTFFILSEGSAVATQTGEKGEVQVLEYASGDYFGELSLLRNQQRAANVKAVTPCVCVTLDRSCFERLLGPVLEILQRNAENYKTYAQIVGL